MITTRISQAKAEIKEYQDGIVEEEEPPDVETLQLEHHDSAKAKVNKEKKDKMVAALS